MSTMLGTTEEEFLGSMLGPDTDLTMDVVRDVLFNCGYDVEDALNTLLELSASMAAPSKGRSFIQALSAPAAKSFVAESKLSEQVLTSLFHAPKPKTAEQDHMMNWGNIARKMASFGQGSETEIAMFSYGKGKDYEVLRQGELQQWKSMNSCFNKAAAAFSNGGKVYASVLSDEGRAIRNLARASQEKASRDIFESRNRTIQNMITIDVHGQNVEEAIRFLKLHLLFCVCLCSVQTIKVITGLGKSNLRQSVVNLLEKENIQWREENRGMLIVTLTRQTRVTFVDASFMSETSESRSKNSIENAVTIDLHGQHVKEGMQILKVHLLFGFCLGSVQTLKVITGYGSQNSGKSMLKQSVVNLLERENIQWKEENRGMLAVKLKGRTQLAFVESD